MNIGYAKGVSTVFEQLPGTLFDLFDSPGARLLYRPSPDEDGETSYERIARLYPDLRLEMEPDGTITLMAPGSLESDLCESEVHRQLANWNKESQLGYAFGPSAVFRLPNGAKRQADAAWMNREAYRQLTKHMKQGFRGVVVPAFVVEVFSPTDRLPEAHAKCREWTAAGVQEVWLIHPYGRNNWCYTGQNVSGPNPAPTLSSTTLLPGFTLRLEPLWDLTHP